ncbi:MAG: hybrid sensor histidine kinase/response regulator, partial [Prevotella sp.]|nr:hybrid sensor histidine kinase/response regulator [Prevotella sp.]
MRKIYVIALLLLTAGYLSGYNLRHISSENGLSNSAILSICQDSDGTMWFGSCDGLNVFNGVRVKQYKPKDYLNNLSGNLIEEIIDAEDGIFWVNTNYGLNRINKYTQTTEAYNFFKAKYFLKRDVNNAIFVYQNNFLYYKQKEMSDVRKTDIKDLNFDDVLNFTVSSDNHIHFFTGAGQRRDYSYTFENGSINLVACPPDIYHERLLYCFDEKNCRDVEYLVDETCTLYEYNLIDKKKYYVYNLKEIIDEMGEIASIIRFKDDYFIGFKTNGLIILRNVPEQQKNFREEEVDIKSGIFCLQKDKFQPIVWIGTDGQGVYMYSEDDYSLRATVFGNFTQQIEKPVRAVFYDSEKTLWLGTKGDGILRISNYTPNKSVPDCKLEYITTANSSLKNNSVYAFGQSAKNILWIGSDDGLNYYSFDEQKIKNFETDVKDGQLIYVHSICEVNDSTLWVATVGAGIVKIRLSWKNNTPVCKKADRIAFNKGEMSYNYFFNIYNQHDSVIWFGNRGYGAYKMDVATEQFTVLSFADASSNQMLNDVFSITCDRKGNIWFGTSYGLVKYSERHEISLFNEKCGFP